VGGAVAPCCLELEHHLTGGVGLHAFVSQRWASDVAAWLFRRLAVVGVTSHGSPFALLAARLALAERP